MQWTIVQNPLPEILHPQQSWLADDAFEGVNAGDGFSDLGVGGVVEHED